MSRENVEVVRRAIEASRSDDLDARRQEGVALWDPACQYTSVMAALEPATYHGHEGLRRYWTDLAKRWSQWRSEPEEILAVSPDTVVATFRFHAIGKDSGVPVQARLGSVFVLSSGKLLRGRTYLSPEEASEAVGLRE